MGLSTYHDTTAQYWSYYIPDCVGPGALANNQVRICKYCKENGFPNEPIVFRKIANKWIAFDYFTGERHQQHKSRYEDMK